MYPKNATKRITKYLINYSRILQFIPFFRYIFSLILPLQIFTPLSKPTYNNNKYIHIPTHPITQNSSNLQILLPLPFLTIRATSLNKNYKKILPPSPDSLANNSFQQFLPSFPPRKSSTHAHTHTHIYIHTVRR